METKILFMVLGFAALYILYDGLFPPAGQKSYIDKTVDLIAPSYNNGSSSNNSNNSISEKIEQEKKKAVKQGEIFYIMDKIKELFKK